MSVGTKTLLTLEYVMAVYGYARVSTAEQNPEAQEQALKAAGCTVIRTDKKSGTTREGRRELETLMDFLRSGDVLIITRIDRLARSISDLQAIIGELKAKGVQLRCTEQPVDTSTAAGKAFLDMLGVFAEFETNLRKERQAEGIAVAKSKGVYTGRKPTATGQAEKAKELHAAGKSVTEIGNVLGISRSSVFRCLRK